jgi:hypothetical protein
MRDAKRRASLRELSALPGRRLLSFYLGISLVFSLPACATRYVEETVTTDASRSSAIPPGAEPIAIAPSLPARDADIEAAGDHIAEAITYLNARRREAALRALNQAEAAMNRALHARASDDQARATLHATLKDLDAATRAIQRGAPDASRQLIALNKTIDNLSLQKQ